MSTQSIITVLKRDHREVSALLEKALKTSESATNKRMDLFATIQESLQRHMAFEEEHLYPVLKAKKSTSEDALEAFEEHAQAKRLLAELEKLSPEDESWKAKMTVLQEDIRHHVKEEEQRGGIFDELKKRLSADELAELVDHYLAVKSP